MHLAALAALNAFESEHAREIPFPAPVFGVIALAVFFTLAIVVWSYRDVANRHRSKFDRGEAPEQGHGYGSGH
jgi:heme/copper-type cytochrome/quinol oxidase subunit 2